MRSDPFDLVGDLLDGQFRIESFVGEGDFTVVYKGHHVGVDAPVAIKCLNLPETLDPALAYPLVVGFQGASRVHYRLARGNLYIAQTIASGSTLAPRTGTVVPYLVREWFEGESLASDLTRRRNEMREGRSLDESLALLETAFDAMEYAHAHGEVHLSINPSNLFLARPDGATAPLSLRVLDFGMARAAGTAVSGAAVGPGAGLHLLSPAYAAPEQLERMAGKPGPPTDVYALALVMMEVLSDRVVMAESDTGLLVERALDEHRRPTPRSHGLKVPSHVEHALSRAVARAPEARQASAGEFWRDLKRPIQTMPLPWAAVAPPRLSRPALPGPSRRPPHPREAPRRKAMEAEASLETLPLTFERNLALPREAVGLDTKAATESEAAHPAVHAGAEAFPSLRASRGSLGASGSPSGFEWPLLSRVCGPVQAAAARFVAFQAASRSYVMARGKGVAVLGAICTGCLVAIVLSWRHSTRHPPAVAFNALAPASAAPPSAPATEEPAAAPAGEPAPIGHFSRAAALRALDLRWRNVAKCRRAKAWGKAWTTITFARDGSASEVIVGPPFVGTPTAQCIADTLAAVRVPPFGDPPVAIGYRVYIAPR
jgi:eukaryotic-like serine/threonine-protein kinase